MSEYEAVWDRPVRSPIVNDLENELECLYRVSQVLSRSLDFRETLSEVLKTLNDSGNLAHGMISLFDSESGDLLVTALHESPTPFKPVRYKPGEGIVGTILENGKPLVIDRISDEDRFLDRGRMEDQQGHRHERDEGDDADQEKATQVHRRSLAERRGGSGKVAA